jgi:pimeloyl-ACP methyl ester carboxylesterase
MAAWVGDFTRRWIPGPMILVGHSLGGAVAAEVALSHPERVVAVVLIAPAGLEVGMEGITEGMTLTRARVIGWYEAARSFVTPLHDPAWLAEPEPEASYDPASDPSYRAAAARVLSDFDFEGIGERFRDLEKPVLLIWGRLDPVIPYQTAARILALLPCARLATLDGALHRPQAEQPDTVVQLIEGFARRPNCQ